MDASSLVLANAAVCLAALIQSVIGVGFGMVAVPLLLLISMALAPGPSIFVMFFLSAAVAFTARTHIAWVGMDIVLLSVALGAAIAGMILGAMPPAQLGMLFGFAILAALFFGSLKRRKENDVQHFGFGGVAAGLLGTVAGMHGPPLVVLYRGETHERARASIAFVFTVGTLISLATLHWQGYFGEKELWLGLQLLPGVILGFLVAEAVRHRFPEKLARQGMVAIAALSAIILIVRSLLSNSLI